jgi:hypothetical protein
VLIAPVASRAKAASACGGTTEASASFSFLTDDWKLTAIGNKQGGFINMSLQSVFVAAAVCGGPFLGVLAGLKTRQLVRAQ